MANLVSAKGIDILAWRASADFATTFRQVILNRMEFCRSDEAAALLSGASRALEDLAASNDMFCARCESLIAEVAAVPEPARLKGLAVTFFTELYEQCAIHHAASAFYQLSMQFIQALAESISRHTCSRLWPPSVRVPGLAIIALGPTGRQEFSPFCQLQFMLVHGEAGVAEEGLLQQYSVLLHEGFAACGFQVDKTITPRNSQWRGSLAEWKQRLDQIQEKDDFNEIVDMLRLTDQTIIAGSAELGADFRQMSLATLGASPVARNNLVSRVVSLSNGIGIMGGIRFEKSGPYRGQFALIENALQPLSAAVSAISLLKHLEATTTPRRIKDLLWNRYLNVDMGEHLLHAWHMLNELLLLREREVHPDWSNSSPFHLDVDEVNTTEQDSLRTSLGAIGTIQRHVGLNFSGTGE